ncbi:MAG: DUF2934 domain-containing protein [Steroidobacteraceae bacterium]
MQEWIETGTRADALASTAAEVAHDVHAGRESARMRVIAEAAYFKALHRGFASGHELEDWLAAESETRRLLREEL